MAARIAMMMPPPWMGLTNCAASPTSMTPSPTGEGTRADTGMPEPLISVMLAFWNSFGLRSIQRSR